MVAKTLVVVTAFDAYMFPEANRVVRPGSPDRVTVSRFDVDATFRVVTLKNGIVNVS